MIATATGPTISMATEAEVMIFEGTKTKTMVVKGMGTVISTTTKTMFVTGTETESLIAGYTNIMIVVSTKNSVAVAIKAVIVSGMETKMATLMKIMLVADAEILVMLEMESSEESTVTNDKEFLDHKPIITKGSTGLISDYIVTDSFMTDKFQPFLLSPNMLFGSTFWTTSIFLNKSCENTCLIQRFTTGTPTVS